MQVSRNHKGRLPVIAQALAHRQHRAFVPGLVPGFLLVGQPDFHGHIGVAVLQTLEQRQRRTELHIRGVAVALFHDILGNAVLKQRAGPVQVTENDGLFRPFRRHHFHFHFPDDLYLHRHFPDDFLEFHLGNRDFPHYLPLDFDRHLHHRLDRHLHHPIDGNLPHHLHHLRRGRGSAGDHGE